MNKNRLEIKKIPLKGFIAMLMNIYENGIDCINMVVEKGDHQDSIWIVDDVPENENIEIKKEENINFENLI